MPIASITVASVTPPAPGKKRAKVVDTTNTVYQVDGSQMHNFAPGSSWSIVYKDDSFNGFTFKVIEKFNPASPTGGQHAPAMQAADTPHGYSAVGLQPTVATKADPLPERIFVCGALNASLGNPSINPTVLTEDQLIVMVNGFRRVFARTFGGKREDSTAPVPNPQRNDALNDEVPF